MNGLALLQIALNVLLAGVFLESAVPKLRHPRGFIVTVLEYRILPPPLARLYARLLPPLELFVALLLLGGVATRSAAAVAWLLLASFVVAVGVNVACGRDLDCGCFGRGSGRRVGPRLLIEDVGLWAVSSAAVWLDPGWATAERWSVFGFIDPQPRESLVGVVVCAAVTLAAATALRRLPPRQRRRRHAIAD